MKIIPALTVIAAITAVLSSASVFGQAPAEKPSAIAPAPAMSAEKDPAMKGRVQPASRPRGRSRAMVDARHCLQLATNLEIHRCAEKYR